jgi:hypothetical protein
MSTVWKSVGQKKYWKLKETPVGTVLAQGTYMGSQTNPVYEQSVNHLIRNEDDVVVVLSGGHLDYQIQSNNIQKGDKLQVSYLGTTKVEKGKFKGKEAHQFDIALPEVMEQMLPPTEGNSIDLSDLD